MRLTIAVLVLVALAGALGQRKSPLPINPCSEGCTCKQETNPNTLRRTYTATCTVLPSVVDRNIFFLKVTADIGTLTRRDMLSLNSNIQGLDLSDCNISEIEAGAFCSNLHSLTNLKLSGNKITQITEFTQTCSSLLELHLDSNQITQIDDNALLSLSVLTHLYLQHNLLQNSTALPRSLIELDLSDNNITTLGSNFSLLTQLQHLDVCGNPLKQTPTSDAMLSLCVSGEAAQVPPDMPHLTNLTLIGSEMQRGELNVSPLVRFTQLSQLTLAHFHLKDLDFLLQTRDLQSLTLRNITTSQAVPSKVLLISLSDLNLDASPGLVNQFLRLNFSNLNHLSLRQTQLVSLGRTDIPASVLTLDIAANPLQCDCGLNWVYQRTKSSVQFLQDLSNTTCNNQTSLLTALNTLNCTSNSDGTLQQLNQVPPTSGDHHVLYIVLGCCLLVLIIIGITLAVVLSVMKKRRSMWEVTPEGGETSKQVKQASSQDMLLKK